jgi:hypothetical protein
MDLGLRDADHPRQTPFRELAIADASLDEADQAVLKVLKGNVASAKS